MGHRPQRCHGCGGSLPEEAPGDAVDRRQVFELRAWVEVTEHQVHAVGCPCCGAVTAGVFPAEVPAPTQYGLGMKAFVVYLDNHHLLPMERSCELVHDLTGHWLSEGTLYNLDRALSVRLEPFMVRTRALLRVAEVVHFDESGRATRDGLRTSAARERYRGARLPRGGGRFGGDWSPCSHGRVGRKLA